MSVEQSARVGVAWGIDDLLRGADLDQFAVPEHGDTLGKLAASAMSWLMNSSVMPSSATSRRIKGDDLGLDDGVERAGRLVGDEQFRTGRDRRGDRHALLLAAGQLMRKGAHGGVWIGQSDAFEQGFGLGVGLRPA